MCLQGNVVYARILTTERVTQGAPGCQDVPDVAVGRIQWCKTAAFPPVGHMAEATPQVQNAVLSISNIKNSRGKSWLIKKEYKNS